MAVSSAFRGSGNSQTYQVLLANFQVALNNPLVERCLALSQLLQDAPLKDMQYVFSVIVENIFGFHASADWGLLTLDKNAHYREFENLSKFLSPSGPIFRLAYRFSEEPAPKFEFPISCLPAPSQLMLQEGKIPPFYANKLHVVNSSCLSSVQLSAFEFYFFHFSYFISNPSVKNTISSVNQQDTLYAHLLEDYLFHFLPIDSSAVPLYQPTTVPSLPSLQSPFGSPYSPIEKNHSFNLHSSSPARPDFLSPIKQKSSLLKKGTVMMVTSTGGNPACGISGSAAESWKSETLLLILKEFYLNQTSLDYQQNTLDLLPKTFVPTHYHVWMVRIFVKHLHFFSNSALSSNQTYGHGQIMIDCLGRLKSLGITQMIQKEMYSFLKSTFDHWPLDASFRVPLEAWLSYIQPLRYAQCDLDPAIWQKFVSQNLLFYTSILHQVLQRFYRMDLSFPKNAYMLFRVTKVFAMENLREMIFQAERSCNSTTSKPSVVGLSSPYMYSEKCFSLRQVSEMDALSNYSPLFTESTFILVSQLLSVIRVAREKASVQAVNQSNTSGGIFSKVFSFFECSGDAYNSDENSPSDIKKVESYLEASTEQLCKLFKEVSPPAPTFSSPLVTNRAQETSSSLIGDNNEIHNLSTVERIQLLNKKKKPTVFFRGNPDLQPVRTYEVSFLVKLFSKISELFNEKYGFEILQLYNNPSILGKMSRQVLAKPVTYYNIIKSSDMQSVSWNTVHLPPRINLRFLAHKQVICYLCGLIFLSHFFGYHPALVLMLVTMLTLLWFLIIAIFYPVPVSVQTS